MSIEIQSPSRESESEAADGIASLIAILQSRGYRCAVSGRDREINVFHLRMEKENWTTMQAITDELILNADVGLIANILERQFLEAVDAITSGVREVRRSACKARMLRLNRTRRKGQ